MQKKKNGSGSGIREFICKKHCEMHQIYMQKTLRMASNLYAKNTAKCIKFICKKTLRMTAIFCKFSCKFCGAYCI